MKLPSDRWTIRCVTILCVTGVRMGQDSSCTVLYNGNDLYNGNALPAAGAAIVEKMNRRVGGMLLFIVALLAVGITPSILGRRTTGTPVAEVIAAPPTVGQCVAAIGASNGQDRNLPVATVLPTCSGSVIGEVISVRSTSPTPVVTTLDEYTRANPDCQGQAESYLGTSRRTVLLGVQWTTSLSVNAVTVGPDAHDRAAGRTWTACVLAAVGQSYRAPLPLRSSWNSRTLPSAFGVCWSKQIEQRGTPTPCTSAHLIQQLAFGFAAGPLDTSQALVSRDDPALVLAGCRRLAATILAVKDPTAGGALEVEAVADPAGAPYVQCAVSATHGRKLIGSVIGLGTKPVPLA
jgi:hypothetical protein